MSYTLTMIPEDKIMIAQHIALIDPMGDGTVQYTTWQGEQRYSIIRDELIEANSDKLNMSWLVGMGVRFTREQAILTNR